MASKEESKYEQQKKIKPLIEDRINSYIEGRLRNDVTEFVSFLRENKMSPQWASTDSYAVSYKSRRVCIIKIKNGEWSLWLNTQYNDDFNVCFSGVKDEMQRILLDNIVYCQHCGKCAPGLNITILGRQLQNACYCPVIRLNNPSQTELDCARKLVILRKAAIAENKAPKVMYVAMSKRNKSE
jgi:hypothetical protein